MDTVTAIEPGVGEAGLLRLMTWLSPSFPVGAFSYSHGVEYAVETGLVTDAASLQGWIGTIVTRGSGRVDAALFLAAHDAVWRRDEALAAWALEYGDALRATREFGVEAEGQGRAFMQAVTKSWPADGMSWLADCSARLGRPVVYPVAVGAAAGSHGLPVRDTLVAYLHAFAANLVSAGVRLVPLGQSDGLRVLAGLELVILGAADAALERPREDIGAATVMADWASASHETQYTRLFRS